VTLDRWLYFPSEGRHALDFFARYIRQLRPNAKLLSCVPEASMLNEAAEITRKEPVNFNDYIVIRSVLFSDYIQI
jgi:hypothetical protein